MYVAQCCGKVNVLRFGARSLSNGLDCLYPCTVLMSNTASQTNAEADVPLHHVLGFALGGKFFHICRKNSALHAYAQMANLYCDGQLACLVAAGSRMLPWCRAPNSPLKLAELYAYAFQDRLSGRQAEPCWPGLSRLARHSRPAFRYDATQPWLAVLRCWCRSQSGGRLLVTGDNLIAPGGPEAVERCCC